MKKRQIYLAFSGGGDKTYLHAGIAFYLKNIFNIKAITLVSGGTYTVPLALVTNSIHSAVSLINRVDFLNYVDILPENQAIKEGGVGRYNTDFFNYLSSIITIKKGSLAEPKLIPIALDIIKKRPVYLSNTPYPIAVEAATAIPYLFVPVKYRKFKFVDINLLNDYYTEPFMKDHNKIPIVAVMLESGNTYATIIKTLLRTMKLGKISKRDLFTLYKVIKQDKYHLKKFISANKKHVYQQANFIFNVKGIEDKPLLLSTSDKKTLFIKGYLIGEQIAARLNYSFKLGIWKHYSNENIIDLNLKNIII